MPERVRQILNRIRDFFKNMKKGARIGLAAGAAVLVVAVAALAIYNATRPYEVLFGGLSSEDMTAVVTAIESSGYSDIRIRGDDTVMVRSNQADRLRALVIQQGFPTSGYSHNTYFDNISALSSSADREQAWLLDVQDYLASTIKWIDGVQDARVTITPGEDRRYILDEQVSEATAGVFVTMQTGRTLTSGQVAAIQRWVASAVQGLTISSVTVEDTEGHRYTTGDDLAGVLDETMAFKLKLESQVNEQLRNNIMNVFVRYFGAENVEVSVHSTVDVTKSYTESLTYYEPDWAADGSTQGRGIIGSRIWDNSLIRGGDTAAGGVVGTSTNTEINEYLTEEGQIRGDETEIYNSGETNYLVSQDKTQSESAPGTITDVRVAIAVNSLKFNLQDREQFVRLAATVAGINAEDEAEKVTIVSYPFYEDNVATTPIGEISTIFGLPIWAVYAAIAGVALFLALLLIILLLRSRKKKKIAILLAQEEEAAAAEAAALAAAAVSEGADIMDVHVEETMQMRKDVRQFVEENPAIAAQMIKNWLRGGEEG